MNRFAICPGVSFSTSSLFCELRIVSRKRSFHSAQPEGNCPSWNVPPMAQGSAIRSTPRRPWPDGRGKSFTEPVEGVARLELVEHEAVTLLGQVPQDRRQVEAEAVDPHRLRPVLQGVDDQVADDRVGGVEIAADAGVS